MTDTGFLRLALLSASYDDHHCCTLPRIVEADAGLNRRAYAAVARWWILSRAHLLVLGAESSRCQPLDRSRGCPCRAGDVRLTTSEYIGYVEPGRSRPCNSEECGG